MSYRPTGTLSALLLLALGASTAAGAPPKKAPAKGAPASSSPRFPAPRGRLVYSIKSPMLTGTSTLMWIDSGKRFRQETLGKLAFGQNTMPMKSWAIGDEKYMYVHQAQLGNQVMRVKLAQKSASMSAPGTGPLTVGKNVGKVVGKATLLGKPCEIREVEGAKMWIWQSLPLKFEGGSPQLTMTATKLDLNPKVDLSQFKVPAGMPVKDFDPGSLRGNAPGAVTPGGAKTAPK